MWTKKTEHADPHVFTAISLKITARLEMILTRVSCILFEEKKSFSFQFISARQIESVVFKTNHSRIVQNLGFFQTIAGKCVGEDTQNTFASN
jgi:hypothetical protein